MLNVKEYNNMILDAKRRKLLKDTDDEIILRKIYKLYSRDSINNNFICYKYINNGYKVHSNILGWLSSAIYNEKNNHNNFINVVSKFMSEYYKVDCSIILKYLSDCNLSDSSLNPEAIVKNIINSISNSNTFDKFKESFNKSIQLFIKDYNINNSITEPIVNERTVKSMIKDPTEDILKSLDKGYKVYYILTKINDKFYVVYIGSGNIKRLKTPRDEEFLREFVDNIPNCDRNLYLIPETTALTKEYAILREKNKIKYFRDNGFLLANIIHYNYIAGCEITDKNTLNKLLFKNNLNIFDLRDYKINCIKYKEFKCIPIKDTIDIESYKI